ncbi:MAG: HD domain-containing protein [Luteitalea sp.]|nr:HD domain-containing protein [Acidobacteriota bacterium]
MEDILRAATVAAAVHAGQTRRGLDEPYINHPLRVAHHAARAGLGHDAVIAALLHDVVEDSTRTWDDLRAEGFTPRALELARLLTKWWESGDEPADADKATYYARILADNDALALKLLDRTDNLQDTARIVAARREFAERYLRKTRREFPPLREACRNPYVRRVFDERLALLEKTIEKKR